MGLHIVSSRPVTDNSIDIAVGRQLRKLRERFNLGAGAMSKRLSISEVELRAIEDGVQRAPATLLLATRLAFFVSTAYFYEGLSPVTATQ